MIKLFPLLLRVFVKVLVNCKNGNTGRLNGLPKVSQLVRRSIIAY